MVIAEHMKDILTLLGEDVQREGLVKTPDRVAKAMQHLTRGYWQDPEEILGRHCSKKITVRW